MKKNLILTLLFLMFVFPQKILAVEDPLAVPNNKFGIHILFSDEIDEAAAFANSNGGQWGYVTIPIQAGDKDIEKWQKFMDSAKKNKIIPIVRLATEGDYFNTSVWRKPTFEDIVDFANFLDSLSWPTKNRYVIIFNEVNRGNEWGGAPDPSEYAEILSFASDKFKEKNSDFFIISSGMDNASITIPQVSYDKMHFLDAMEYFIPGVLNKIDAVSSHSYPNPAFSQPPQKNGEQSIASFLHEKKFIEQFTNKDLPVFITETGWTKNALSQETIATYYNFAFTNVWNNESIVAVTPFLLRANQGPFMQFSLLEENGGKSIVYDEIFNLPKVKGKPILPDEKDQVLGAQPPTQKLPVIEFKESREEPLPSIQVPNSLKTLARWLLKI